MQVVFKTLKDNKMHKIDLTQLEQGKKGEIVEIHGGYGLQSRLDSLGIRVGKKVIKVSSQLARGPVTLKVDNSHIALGFGMAKKILVKTLEG